MLRVATICRAAHAAAYRCAACTRSSIQMRCMLQEHSKTRTHTAVHGPCFRATCVPTTHSCCLRGSEACTTPPEVSTGSHAAAGLCRVAPKHDSTWACDGCAGGARCAAHQRQQPALSGAPAVHTATCRRPRGTHPLQVRPSTTAGHPLDTRHGAPQQPRCVQQRVRRRQRQRMPRRQEMHPFLKAAAACARHSSSTWQPSSRSNHSTAARRARPRKRVARTQSLCVGNQLE
jgi:hypothetical protein